MRASNGLNESTTILKTLIDEKLIMSSKLIPPIPTQHPKYEYQKLQYGFGMVSANKQNVKIEEAPDKANLTSRENPKKE